ncbi:ATP-utilizing chromatin assembly and remodelling N-terminal-domain-containing protein [Yarrowia lipolytica]|nr:ATP-utilizing chromatin assembly and remodelling N-terminal-domain-containing protein [Yarrowia lipolytica]RDW39200.1 ATP-utilizing chromatin assembly and remodelling N-terminal-domain-containing protein [Yarrowia lipolytica]RDW42991.1 ATP-utilizing chromatin assembly and remodelling N-terminal-domain-containing protein [Yarrowia lipolytica]RDW49722.1 ATP-utilizing chromatin assembly and remodelling N-terminal-domain-containing protein [Yarrowia lipolytica]
MVLFKRKAIHFAPPIYVEEDDEVWWIDATGEYFNNYDDYLTRMDFYKQKKFICEVTGHSCLTLFEALKSELHGSKEIMDAFPENLKEPVLRRIQFSTISRLDGLVDTLYGEFKKDFFPGEIVIAIIETATGATERVPAIIREKAKFNSITLDSGDVRPATTKYRLEAVSDPNKVYVCDETQLTRDRKNFTKVTLKTFIKYSAKKENWNGAPWLVRPEYAEKYRIDQTVPVHLTQYRGNPSPEELRKQRTQDRLKAKQARDNEKNDIILQRQKLKMENKEKNAADALIRTLGGLSGLKERDIQVPVSHQNGGGNGGAGLGAKTLATALASVVTERRSPPPKQVIREDLEHRLVGVNPKPVFHFDKLYPSDLTEVSLEVWTFINVYKEVLVLDSFTYDDFIDALRYEGESDLLNEIHCALLSQVVGTNSDSLLVEYPDDISDDEEEEDYDEEEEEEEEEVKKEEQEEEEVKEEEPRGRTRRSSRQIKKEETEEAEEEEEQEEEEEEEEEQEQKNSKSVSPGAENKGANYAVFKGVDWKTRLQRRNFKDGGWQVILIGLLYNLTYYEPWEDFINGCLDVWAAAKAPVSLASARDRYFDLDFTQKVKIIQILCNLIHPTDAIRAYIEECMGRVTELRRDKVDKQREYKIVSDDIRVLENEVKRIELEMEEKKISEDKDGSEKKAGGNGDNEESEPPSKKSKTDNDELLSTLRTKIQDRQETLKEIIAVINAKDEEIRFADVNRLRLLGKDRFHNRYWWFEGNGIEDAGGSEEEEGTGFTMGRLWVQGPFEEEIKFCLTGDIPQSKREVEGEGYLEDYTKWGYLEHPKELGELIKWLNQWGSREHKLKKELLSVLKKIKASMVSRLEDLGRENELRKEDRKEIKDDEKEVKDENTDEDHQNGASSGDGKDNEETKEDKKENEKNQKKNDVDGDDDDEFDRVCSWSNGYAVSKLGHSHYEGPAKKPARKDTKKKKR